jgi:hypothetical protein
MMIPNELLFHPWNQSLLSGSLGSASPDAGWVIPERCTGSSGRGRGVFPRKLASGAGGFTDERNARATATADLNGSRRAGG